MWRRDADTADRSPGLIVFDPRPAVISANGEGLERIVAVVHFVMFRPMLETAAPRRGRSRGGRTHFDHVLMLKVLILQAMHSLPDELTEFLVREQLSFMRFLELERKPT